MTNWEEPTAEELIFQMENEILRIHNLKISHTLPPLIITKNLYDKLKETQK